MYKAIEDGKSVFRPLTTTFNSQVLETVLKTANGSFKTIKVDGRGLLNEHHQVTDVLGRQGGYFHQSRAKPREIKVLAHLKGNSSAGLSRQYSLLGKVLATDKPAWLTFSDDPDLSFLAQYEGVEVAEERGDDVVLTLSFVCYDPFKHSAEKRQNGANVSTLTKTYATDVDIKPLIRVTVKSGTPTYLRILHVAKGQYIRIDLPSANRLKANDVVEFDCQTGSVTINGTNALQYLDMVNSRFFSLSNGSNRLTANVALDWEIIYREVYR